MIQFKVDSERCVQCEECIMDCPAAVIAMGDDGLPGITDEARCIRCQHCLAVCPTGAVSILGKDPDAGTPLAGNLPDPNQLTTLIKGRRSVRRFQEQDLAPERIDQLLNITAHAPTGVNDDSVLFTVVRQRAVLDKLREYLIGRIADLLQAGQLPEGMTGNYLSWVVKAWQGKGHDIMFRGAPHLLVTSSPLSAPCGEQDPLIALTIFDLVAQAHGVGTVWDGIFMMALSVCPEAAAKLGIPADHKIGYAMAFGTPAVEYHRTVQRGPAKTNTVNL